MDTDAIDAQGYGDFVNLVFNDAYGGWPMIQNTWDQNKFMWENVMAENLRYEQADTILLSYPYLDTFNTSHEILYVSFFFMKRSFIIL
jgi:hypothetical protein